MNTKDAYNTWAESYDSVENPTRSLDEIVVKSVLTDITGKDIVEVGCGTGKNSKWFESKGKSLIAFDFSKEMLEKAKQKVQNNQAKFFIQDITKPWNLKDNICDIVSINLVLEHIKDIDFVFSESNRILRSNGVLYICELHPEKQKEGTVARFTDQKTNKEIKIVSYYHSKKEFEKSANHNGFRNIEMKDWYDQTNKKTPRLLSITMMK